MDRAASRRRERVLQASSGEPLRLGSVYEELERSATWQRRRDLTNPGTALSRARRMARLEAVLRRRFDDNLDKLRVLDVGCGEGAPVVFPRPTAAPSRSARTAHGARPGTG